MTQTIPNLKLDTLGIHNVASINHNPSYDELFSIETSDSQTGFEKGTITDLGAVAVDTGAFTGRSAKDKYIVEDDVTRDSVWWAKDGSTNTPLSPTAWTHLKQICSSQLSNKFSL